MSSWFGSHKISFGLSAINWHFVVLRLAGHETFARLDFLHCGHLKWWWRDKEARRDSSACIIICSLFFLVCQFCTILCNICRQPIAERVNGISTCTCRGATINAVAVTSSARIVLIFSRSYSSKVRAAWNIFLMYFLPRNA